MGSCAMCVCKTKHTRHHLHTVHFSLFFFIGIIHDYNLVLIFIVSVVAVVAAVSAVVCFHTITIMIISWNIWTKNVFIRLYVFVYERNCNFSFRIFVLFGFACTHCLPWASFDGYIGGWYCMYLRLKCETDAQMEEKKTIEIEFQFDYASCEVDVKIRWTESNRWTISICIWTVWPGVFFFAQIGVHIYFYIINSSAMCSNKFFVEFQYNLKSNNKHSRIR